MIDAELMNALEAEAAHAATEAFLATVAKVLKARGLPETAMVELAGSDHVHWTLVFNDGAPVAVRMAVTFTTDAQAVQTLLRKYQAGLASAVVRKIEVR